MSKPISNVPSEEEIDRVLAMARMQGGPDLFIMALMRMLPILLAVAYENGEEALQDWQRMSRAVEKLIRIAYAVKDTKQ